MTQPPPSVVVLLETRTGFEAETIAAALNARGIEARTADTAMTVMYAGTVVRAKVLVPAAAETLARQVLDELRAEMTSIDWDAMDMGPEEDTTRLHAARRGRRLLMTICIVLVPIGLAVFALGNDRHDMTLQTIGGAVMLCAVAIGASLFVLAGKRVDPDD